MRLRYKFILPINLVIVLGLTASLAWERGRFKSEELGERRTWLDEEVRAIRSAIRTFGDSPRFTGFLDDFCRAADPVAAPEHQIVIVKEGNIVTASAAGPRTSLEPTRLSALAAGVWTLRKDGEPYLVRVEDDGRWRIIVGESIRPVRALVLANLWNQAGWSLGVGALVLVAVNVIMGRVVLRPVALLSRAIRQLEGGRLGVEVVSSKRDELGALSHRFNAMSRTLADRVDADRRALETARRVQAHLLPPPHFRLGCLEVAGRSVPSGLVGGDIYDVQPLRDGRVGVLMADLSGHNVAAALHTAMLRAIVWREAEDARSPGEVLDRLNNRLCRDLPDEHFATAFFGWIDPRSGQLEYANAGHPTGYVHPATGPLHELRSTGLVLGVLSDTPYDSLSLTLEPGSVLLLFTDGIIETESEQGGLWGDDEMLSLVRAANGTNLGEILDQILDRVGQFRRRRPQQDDVTLMLARYIPHEPTWPGGSSFDVHRTRFVTGSVGLL